MGKKQGHLKKDGRRWAQASFHPTAMLSGAHHTAVKKMERATERKNLFARLESTLFIKKKEQGRFTLR
jgi:hypothetical protein